VTDDDAFWAAYDAKVAKRRRERLLTLDDGEEAIRKALLRKARPLEIGGFRPTGAPDATCFGEVRLCAPGEVWPTHKGTPMYPLAQFNVAEAGMQTGPLADTALVTVFTSPDFGRLRHPMSKPEGEADFSVRTYSKLDDLVPVDAPPHESPLKPFECRWLDPVDDYADHSLACDHIDGAEISVYDFDWHQTSNATKIGGWPALLQSEPWWMVQPDAPEAKFAIQIWYEEKAAWYCPSLFLARGTEDPDLWLAELQAD
jgi:hypothetical protein